MFKVLLPASVRFSPRKHNLEEVWKLIQVFACSPDKRLGRPQGGVDRGEHGTVLPTIAFWGVTVKSGRQGAAVPRR